MVKSEIGHAAGKIWHYLHDHGETSMARLKKELGLHPDLVLKGIGWLAREDKVEFVKKASVLLVKLK